MHWNCHSPDTHWFNFPIPSSANWLTLQLQKFLNSGSLDWSRYNQFWGVSFKSPIEGSWQFSSICNLIPIKVSWLLNEWQNMNLRRAGVIYHLERGVNKFTIQFNGSKCQFNVIPTNICIWSFKRTSIDLIDTATAPKRNRVYDKYQGNFKLTKFITRCKSFKYQHSSQVVHEERFQYRFVDK